MGAGEKHTPPQKARTSGSGSADLAWRSPLAVVLFVCITAAGLTADLLTKHYAFTPFLADPQLAENVQLAQASHHGTLTNRQVLQLLGRRGELMPGVSISLSTNPGVVFGLSMPRWAVTCATILTMALVGWFFASGERNAWAVHVALALILAGAMGNFHDRLFSEVALPGMAPIRNEVRDFIDCSRIPLPFGLRYVWVFNVADAWLVLGVATLPVHWLLSGRKEQKARSKKTPSRS